MAGLVRDFGFAFPMAVGFCSLDSFSGHYFQAGGEFTNAQARIRVSLIRFFTFGLILTAATTIYTAFIARRSFPISKRLLPMKIQFKNIKNDRITVADDLGQFSIRPFKICDLASTFCDQYILSLHDQNDEAVFVLSPESFDSMELATRAMIEGEVDVHDDFRSIISRCSHAGFVA